MIIISNYHIRSYNNLNYIISKETHLCSVCNTPLRHRTTARRSVIEEDGKVNTYYIRRFSCRCCGASHNELPDFIVPHKHYSKRAIEKAIHDKNSSCVAENSTIQRWIKEWNHSQE